MHVLSSIQRSSQLLTNNEIIRLRLKMLLGQNLLLVDLPNFLLSDSGSEDEKIGPENDQLPGHFQRFFQSFF